MLKLLIGVGVVSVAIVGILAVVPFTMEVITETNTVEVEVRVNELEEKIKTAQDSARAEIETKAKAEYDAFVAKELKRVEDEVKVQYITELEPTIELEDY